MGEVETTSLSWRDDDTIHFAGQAAFDTVVGDYGLAAAAPREIWRSATQSCGEWYARSRPAPDGGGVLVVESYDTAPALETRYVATPGAKWASVPSTVVETVAGAMRSPTLGTLAKFQRTPSAVRVKKFVRQNGDVGAPVSVVA